MKRTIPGRGVEKRTKLAIRRRNARKGPARSYRARVEPLEDRCLLAAIITVNSTADSDIRDTLLTLREAILINNRSLAVGSLSAAEQLQVSGTPSSTDTDTIAFKILGSGVRTISPLSALPTITDPAIIDGYTQPGASANTLADGSNAVLLIELNGGSAGSGASGLRIAAPSTTIRGLVINRFSAFGIEYAPNVEAFSNVIAGNFIGTNPAGTAALPNGGGIGTQNSAGGIRIGGTTPGRRFTMRTLKL